MAPTPPTSPSRPTPRVRWPDSTLPLLGDPYGFIAGQPRRLGSDVFASRLLGAPALFRAGADAARLFYDEDRFFRAGTAPRRVLRTLFGVAGAQGLDGAAHRHRKQLFLSLMTPEWITIELMKVAVIALTRWMAYVVPPQDLRIPARRVPAAPNSRLLISQVSSTAALHEAPT